MSVWILASFFCLFIDASKSTWPISSHLGTTSLVSHPNTRLKECHVHCWLTLTVIPLWISPISTLTAHLKKLIINCWILPDQLLIMDLRLVIDQLTDSDRPFARQVMDEKREQQTHRLTDWLTDLLTDWMTNLLTDSDWLTEWLTDWLAKQTTNWLTDNLIDSDWLTDWLTDWPTDWLVEWLAH